MIRSILSVLSRLFLSGRVSPNYGFDLAPPTPVDTKPLVVLAVGHSRLVKGKPEGGAVSVGGVSEWSYNSNLARQTADILLARGYRCEIISRCEEGGTYGAAMTWLAGELRSRGAAIAVELHFNAAGASARGHEWLFWHSSTAGQRLAAEFDRAVKAAIPELPRRGIKLRTSADRGADFLSKTHCPAVIAEPFFGSNVADWKIAINRQTDLAYAYARAISAYLATA